MMDWQQDLADVAYEYDPATGSLRYDEVDVTVPRQSGKTTITLAKKVHRLTVMARQWGPQRSTYTAQTRLAARKKLERDFAEVLRSSRGFREVPHSRARPSKMTEWRLTLNNGSEAIQFGPGSFLQIDAPSRTGGHGDTLDDGTIDEAFAHEDDTVEAAMRPAMATRRNAQLWVLSTAGDAKSSYLWRKVLAGRKATLEGRHGRVCYVEYSAPDDADPGDPATWWGCMPALGVTVTEDFVRGEWDRAQRRGQEGVNSFARAYLNQWPDVPVLGGDGGALPLQAWLDLADPDAERGSDVVFGADVAEDRSAWVAVAWTRPDGSAHVVLANDGRALPAHRLVEECKRLSGEWGGTVVPPRAFVDDLEREGVPVESLKSGEFSAACGAFADAVDAGRVFHGNQPALSEAVKAARWRSAGSAGERAFQLKDSPEVGPLAAAVRALHGLTGASSREPFLIVT